MRAASTGGIGAEDGPFSAGVEAAVRAELETMLMAPIFVQSGRCKRFLTYVVEQALRGNSSQLKERIIGVTVFERANDYDTGDDSIVRVTANEVRKRIGQFYQESPATHPIQIELARGSYVPEFRIQPSPRSEKSVEIATPDPREVESRSIASPLREDASSASPFNRDAVTSRTLIVDFEVPAKISSRRKIIYSVILILLIAGAAVLWTWNGRAAKRLPDLWNSFLHTNVPILVCIDTHNLQPSPLGPSEDGQRFVDLVLRRQIISLDDAAILSSMASVLGKKGIPFQVVGAEETSLADLRRQPVILIGAIDNKWTLRLTQALRYRIEVANPPGSGSGKEPIASIVDAQNPTMAPTWTTDLSIPFAAWKNDYAIVARIDDATTGVPMLIEAGLGNDGTVAASELITSGAMTMTLANEPTCKSKSSFEAVIGTQIIDTKSGPPHVLRLTCW